MHNTSRSVIAALTVILSVGGVAASQATTSKSAVASFAPALGNIASGIATNSGASEIALAQHLTATGAKMYGAHWCKYCTAQKHLFGKEAWQKVSYIECDRGGQNPNPGACNQAGVRSFPTWLINGKGYVGQMSLFRLAKLSGYKGATNFRNRL
jgi:glutaredoxin